MNKHDYKLLILLNKDDCNSPIKSKTALRLSKEANFSISKVRKTLKEFVELGYVKEGLKEGSAKSFYISKEGIQILSDILKGE